MPGPSAMRHVSLSTGPASATTPSADRPRSSVLRQAGRLPVVGADLFYEVEGRGRAVVLVHGFALDARMWDEQVAALRAVATVVRYDLRGFGRSSLPALGVAYSHGGDLLSLLDHLGLETAFLVGLSMGGLVAMHATL